MNEEWGFGAFYVNPSWVVDIYDGGLRFGRSIQRLQAIQSHFVIVEAGVRPAPMMYEFRAWSKLFKGEEHERYDLWLVLEDDSTKVKEIRALPSLTYQVEQVRISPVLTLERPLGFSDEHWRALSGRY